MDDESNEFDFFKVLLFSQIANLPRMTLGKVLKKDPLEMYKVAKGMKPNSQGQYLEPLEFNQFLEYIQQDLAKCVHYQDSPDNSVNSYSKMVMNPLAMKQEKRKIRLDAYNL